MPKKNSKAVRKDGASVENPGELANSSKSIILNNCDRVQIGDGNTLLNLVEIHPEGGQGTHSKLLVDQAGLLVLRNILTQEWMPYGVLQTSVKDVLSKVNQTFFKYAGTPLEEFLTRHKDEFIIKRRKGRKFVRLKRNLIKAECEETALAFERENEEVVDVSSASDSDESPSSSPPQTLTAELFVKTNADDGWVMAKSKKERKRKVPEVAGEARMCPRNDNQHPMYEKFVHIISDSNDTDTLFIPSHEVYKVNPLKCCLHIVSMWNSPYRPVSFIVIGIEKDSASGVKLNGAEDNFNDVQFYEKLFDINGGTFNGVPLYAFHRLFYDSMLFGIIEIKSSFGHCKPIFVKNVCSIGDIHLEANQLWYMKKDEPILCRTEDYSQIFMWFIGQKNTPRAHEVTRAPIKTALEEIPCEASKESTTNTGISSFGKSFIELWEKTKGFKSGSYVLISGDLPQNVRNMKKLALIHWKAVYDFDIMSTKTGTFNAMQDQIENTYHLRIGTWQDAVPEIREESTWWCFMRGRCEIHESRTDLDLDTKINAIETHHKWFRTVKQSIADNGESLAAFSEDSTPLTFVILWPVKEDIALLMIKFLERVIDRLSYQPQVIVCLHERLSENGKVHLNTLCAGFREHLFVSQLDFTSMCQGLANQIAKSVETLADYSMPKKEEYESKPITKKDAIWLSEDIDVLYLHNIYPKQESTDIERELTNFYKGGSLHWPMWYLNGGGTVEIDRDILKSLEEKISCHLNNYRTTVVTLYHNPGAGGSTLAKRVLWKFHEKVPCVQAKTLSKTHSKDLKKKIAFIHKKTHLPVLVLIDGEDETKIKYLRTILKYSVILYVKRHPYNIINQAECDDVYLKGLVSQAESHRLAEKYGERCDDVKRNALRKLSKEVSQGMSHNLYEFGMTAFCHEFKGTATYVEGYLQLRENPTKELLPWQLCLGYLSLVYYYGQISIPCQFFASLFGKPAQYAMSFEDDFPHPISEFVVKDTDEMGKNCIRICHFLIAKEILEQLLTRKRNEDDQSSDTLSLPARRNLAQFCKQFIEYASSKKARHLSAMARYLLTRTFIFRDAKDMGENECQQRRRPVLSKVIIDIPADQLFTERLSVLEKLSESFPTDPNFLAHVGRFYTYCRPNEEEKAESYFNAALEMCDQLNKGKTEDQLSDSMKSSMMHIYHMYGIVKHRTIKKLLTRHPENSDTKFRSQRNKVMNELIDTAEVACEYFKKSRDVTPESREAYTFAYTGEIEIRIQVCDFIKMRCLPKSQQCFNQISSSDIDARTKRFFLTSIHVIDVLLLECCKDIELSADDVSCLRRLVQWYREVFRNEKFSSVDLIIDTVCQKRIAIIEKKNLSGHKNAISGLEHVHDPVTIKEIVCLYEEIFKEVTQNGLVGGKKSLKELDHDYREWILAIRQGCLEETYSLEDVLRHVQNWYSLVKSPMATFYYFVVNSLLGFGADGKTPKTDCLVVARDLQEELKKMTRLLLRPKYPREWLGDCGGGISVLIPGNKYVGLGMGVDDKETHRSDLVVCKGTIRHPNKNPVGGYIAYDIATSVNVFYLPIRANLIGQRYAGQRVEFHLAFSVERGYEAFKVKLLKRFGCSRCGKAVEFRSVDNYVICTCGETVYKDDFTDVGEDAN